MVNKKSSKETIRRDFEVFADKISRLETLRQELSALDTKGFENEASIIKSKLMDINAIPEIESEIQGLRDKIRRRCDGASEDEKKEREQIEQMSSRLQKETKLMKDKIGALEKAIETKKTVSMKKQLSNEEVEYVKDIPSLEDELKSLRRKFDEHTHAAKIKIDSGVGVIVDTKFDDFVQEIKSELTERLKEKEMVADAQLKADLEKREELFAKKYKELVEEFHKKYKQKVHDELNKEVKKKFDQELSAKLESEKRKVISMLIKDNLSRLQAERNKMISSLNSDYKEKEKELMNSIKKKEEEHRTKAALEKERLNKKILEIQRKEKLLGEREDKDRIKITRELAKDREIVRKEIQRLKESKKSLISEKKHEYSAKMERLKEKEEALKKKEEEMKRVLSSKVEQERKTLLEEMRKLKALEVNAQKEAKRIYEMKIAEYKKQHDDKFAAEVELLKRKVHEDSKRKMAELEAGNENKLKKELESQQKEMKARLEREYQSRLKEEIAKREVILEQKKRDLEKHILSQAKKLFN